MTPDWPAATSRAHDEVVGGDRASWQWPPPTADLDAISCVDVFDVARAQACPLDGADRLGHTRRPGRWLVLPLAASLLGLALLSARRDGDWEPRKGPLPTHAPLALADNAEQAAPTIDRNLAAEPLHGGIPDVARTLDIRGPSRDISAVGAAAPASSPPIVARAATPPPGAAALTPAVLLPAAMPAAPLPSAVARVPDLGAPVATPVVAADSPSGGPPSPDPLVAVTARLANAATSPAIVETPVPDAVFRDEASVREVLTQYGSAYSRLDARAAGALWPAVDVGALGRAFAELRSQRVTFEGCDITVEGPQAKASCRGAMTYVPRMGDPTPRTESRAWRFELEKGSDASWRIASARISGPPSTPGR